MFRQNWFLWFIQGNYMMSNLARSAILKILKIGFQINIRFLQIGSLCIHLLKNHFYAFDTKN